MKVCERCGDEICTKDGENMCERCERLDATYNSKKRKNARTARRAKDDIMKSFGLVKVKGAIGGTYWE